MKTLMQMHADQDKGVLFYETVTSFKGQRHSYIEAVPVPWEFFEQMPGYFHEGIQASEAEWSQHQKLIDFSKRPGGFRRAMVPNLPYFMVQWDYKGEKGYGHVIEGAETATGEGETYDFDEGANGASPDEWTESSMKSVSRPSESTTTSSTGPKCFHRRVMRRRTTFNVDYDNSNCNH
jgi:hypothetical protein